MVINNVIFNCDLSDIITELQNQLNANSIPLLQRSSDSGNDIMVSCPYHKDGQERRPSAGIRKSDGKFHCFVCNKSRELQEVISYCFGYTNDLLGVFGWNWLLKNFATISVEERKDIQLNFSRANKVKNKYTYVSEKELEKYRYWNHPYWKKRGIIKQEIINFFDLGYDKETQSITFPIRDVSGNCLFVARRKVNYKEFNYPKGVEKPLYGYAEFLTLSNSLNAVESKEVFVTESMIDCILLWQSGFFAVAFNGVGSELQFKQLNDIPCRKLILATDNDEAGRKARDLIKRKVKGKLITEIQFPDEVKDVGELSPYEISNIKDWEVF